VGGKDQVGGVGGDRPVIYADGVRHFRLNAGVLYGRRAAVTVWDGRRRRAVVVDSAQGERVVDRSGTAVVLRGNVLLGSVTQVVEDVSHKVGHVVITHIAGPGWPPEDEESRGG